MKRSEIFFGLLRIPVDFLTALLALIAAYFLRAQQNVLPRFFNQPDIGSFPIFSTYLTLAIIGALIFVIIMSLFRLYSIKISDALSTEIRRVLSASLIWVMFVITYYFFIRAFPFSRLVLFYGAAFLFIFCSIGRVAVRMIQQMLLARGIGVRQVVFVGKNSITDELMRSFDYLGTAKTVGVVGSMKEFADFYSHHRKIEDVIQTKDNHAEGEEIVEFCREHQLRYHFVPDLLDVHRTNIEISAIGDIPLISLRPTPLDGWGSVVKRIFDIVASTLGLIILSPFFAIIALAIKLDSPGTVFFRYLDNGEKAKRIGVGGKPFHCFKFRTMKMGTHNLRYTKLAEKNVRKGTPLVKIENDPRITKLGAFLRRFSIDELPQLWNVLIGEMSLVGPRPHLPEEVANYDRHHKFVLTIKPGITGLAQISGRSDLSFEKEVRLDTYYIENWSVFLDLKILFKTIFVVLKPYKE